MKPQDTNRKGARLRISEIYASVQGEGILTGTPSIFVRTSGCNLRCWFCDTPFASWQPEGSYLTTEEIADQVARWNVSHVVLTGGEPMIYANIGELCLALKQAKAHLTIETAGTVARDVPCDLMSISPKLQGSAPAADAGSWRRRHNQRRERLEVVRELMGRHEYQLKFVVDSSGDANEVLEYLERLGSYDRQRVLLMPQGITQPDLEEQAAWLRPWCETHNMRFCQRAHIEWFGNRRGT